MVLQPSSSTRCLPSTISSYCNNCHSVAKGLIDDGGSRGPGACCASERIEETSKGIEVRDCRLSAMFGGYDVFVLVCVRVSCFRILSGTILSKRNIGGWVCP